MQPGRIGRGVKFLFADVSNMPQFSSDLPTVLALIALALVIFEMAFFGFATLFLIYAAIGCVVASLGIYLGLLPATITSAVLTVALVAAISALCLWKPLKKLQQVKRSVDDQPNVFKGVKFCLDVDLHANSPVKHRYSGIEWDVYLAEGEESLPAGTKVEVIKTAVGRLVVRKISG